MSLGQILLLILAAPVTYLLLFLLLRMEERLVETEPAGPEPVHTSPPADELVIRDRRVPVRR